MFLALLCLVFSPACPSADIQEEPTTEEEGRSRDRGRAPRGDSWLDGGTNDPAPYADAGSDVSVADDVSRDTGMGNDASGNGPDASPDQQGEDPVADMGSDVTVDPCDGVVCDRPHSNTCEGGDLRVYESPGTCRGGGCTYEYTLEPCEHGCKDSRCNECSVDDDCGDGAWCDGGDCELCNTNTRCGSECTDCTDTDQYCNAEGTACVECRTSSDCDGYAVCTESNICEANSCTLPPEACSNGDASRDACDSARIVSRVDAESGTTRSGDLYFDSNDDSECASSSGEDHFYRIFLYPGDSLSVTMDVDSWDGFDPVLAVFRSSTECTGTTCDNLDVCEDDGGSGTDERFSSFVAPAAGWYTIKADAWRWISSSEEDWYRLEIDLECLVPGCGC